MNSSGFLLFVSTVPIHRGFHSLVKCHRRAPSQFGFYFGVVNGISEIMPLTIRDKCNHVGRVQICVNAFTYCCNYVKIVLFAISTHIIRLPVLSVKENILNGCAVITDEEPISDIGAVSIYRHFFTIKDS